jgi:predicted anti-sigma-YlaC factor YlaD
VNCKSTGKKLIFFLDNSLNPEETVLVAAHLEQCPECRAKLEFLKEILAQADIEKTTEVNPFLFTRIQSRLEQVKEHKTKRILQPLAISVALVIGILSGILLGQITVTPNTIYPEREIAYLFQDDQIENMESLLLEDDF